MKTNKMPATSTFCKNVFFLEKHFVKMFFFLEKHFVKIL